jgi:hypothetical protein
VANPQAEVDRIAAFIGSCGPAAVRPYLIEVGGQREATSEEWRARFRSDYGNGDVVDRLWEWTRE